VSDRPDQPDNSNTEFLERKLATILSADVAEFSRLMGEDEEQTLKIFREHKKVFESLVAMHRGRIFNTAGDAILAEFGSAVEAVRCATDIQAALRTRNDQLPPKRQVRFRIGINLGDVMVQGQDLLGDGVNVAARLQTAAQPGGICLSGSVYDQIRNKLSLSFQSLGEKSYKNIQQPVRTFSITEADGSGVIPPENRIGASAAKWGAIGLVCVLLAGGCYWAYSVNQRNKAEHAREIAATTPVVAKPSVAPSEPAEVAKTEGTQPPPAKIESAPPVVASKIGSAKQPGAARPTGSAATNGKGAAAVTAGASAGAGVYDGDYSGPICYGPTKMEVARCYRAQGTIKGTKITSQWEMGHDTPSVMILTGDVTSSGDVKIEMELHRNTADGERLATIDLTGTVRNGQINTSGAFRKGRTATLNWHKISDGAQ
jgi:class 3 adenylate cyclase